LADLAAPGAKLRGVTATAAPAGATTEQLVLNAGQALKAVVLVTGERDLVSDGRRVHAHRTDVAVLRQVIGAGDVLSAVIAACGGVGLAPWSAATNGLAIFAAAARLAARESKGPGTFWPAFLDALATLGPEHLAAETDQTVDIAVEAQQR
jgi:hydroxyethylthiazole kinase